MGSGRFCCCEARRSPLPLLPFAPPSVFFALALALPFGLGDEPPFARATGSEAPSWTPPLIVVVCPLWRFLSGLAVDDRDELREALDERPRDELERLEVLERLEDAEEGRTGSSGGRREEEGAVGVGARIGSDMVEVSPMRSGMRC